MPLHNSTNWINEGLPKNWNYGVMHDGRIFFIDEEQHRTTWMHPTLGHPLQTGLMDSPNLPSGWQYDIDDMQRICFVDHVHGFTTHNIPTDDNTGSSNLVTPRSSTFERTSEAAASPLLKTSSTKRKSQTKSLDRYPLARRDPEFPAELQGWLLRMEGALLKQWKKRWFVLAQQHLFCYEDISEKKCLSTYYLPGHTMKSAYGEPGVLKRFSIKIENDQAKTLYVASDDAGDMQVWMNAVGKYSSSNINNINSNRGTADAKFFIEGDENVDDVFSHNPPRRSSSVGSRNKKSLRRSSSRQSALQNISSNFAAGHNSEVATLKSSYSLHNSFNNTLRSNSSKQQLNSPFKLNYTEQRCRTPVYSSSNAFENASNKKSFSSASLQNRNPQQFDQSIDYVNELRGDVIDGATTSQHNFNIQKNYLIKNSLPNTQQQFTDNSFPNSNQPRSSHYDFNKQLQPQQLQSQRDPATPSSTFSVASLNSDRNYFDRNSNFYKSKSAFNAAPTTNYQPNYLDNPGDISTNLNRNNFNNLSTNVNSYPNNNLMIESHLNSQPAYNDILRPKLNKNINGSFHHNSQQQMQQQSQKQRNEQLHQPYHHQQRYQYSSNFSTHHNQASHRAFSSNKESNQSLNDQSVRKQTNQPMDQSISYSINQPIGQRVNQITKQSSAASQSPQSFQDNFSSVSKYSSSNNRLNEKPQKPPRMSDVNLMKHQQQPEFYPQYQQNHQHQNNFQRSSKSVESLNTLKTAASSKTSSKNTYILNNPESENKLSENHSSSVYDSNMFNNQQRLNRDSNSSYVGKHSTLSNQQQQLQRQQQSDWNPLKYNIDAIKEDPDMPDADVLTSRNLQDLQRKLASHTRLRLSISVQDLMGRSYEELVLFLIQLKRSQSELQKICEVTKSQPAGSIDYNLMKQTESAEKQMEVTQPLINLLDNMLTMGSLYNGDSLMYASQYKTNQLKPEEVVPAKPMLEFNRIRQERSLLRSSRRSSPSPPSRRSNNQNNPRPTNDGDDDDDDDVSAEVIVGRLEVQLNELHRLDGLMHAQSTIVSDLLQDKVLLEKSLHEVDKQQKLLSSAADDDIRLAPLNSQKTSLQDDVARVVLQIQQQQQVLNKTRSDLDTCERAIIQLRNKWQLINKDINAPHDPGEHRFEASHNVNKNPRLFEMEQQLRNVESALKGAGSKKSTIYNDITLLKRSKSVTYVPEDEDSLNNHADNNQSHNIYLETDLDRNITENISTIITTHGHQDDSMQRSRSLPRGINFNNHIKNQNNIFRQNTFEHSNNLRNKQNDYDRHKGKVVNNNNDNLTNNNNINRNITDDINNNINNNSSDLVNENSVTNHPRPSRLSAFESLKIKIPEKRQQQTMNANHASQSKNYNEQQYNNIASDRNARTNDHLISKSYDMNHNFESTNTSRSVLPYSDNNVKGINGGVAEPPASSSHVQTRASYIQNVHAVDHHSPELGAEFDENTIAKAVLRPPPQVDIPQRYIPDPEDLNNIKNNLNPVQNYFKQQKVEQMKKLLAAQSLQEFNLNELAATNGEDVNERIRLELKEREDILDMKMNLAKQVTEKSRHLAANQQQHQLRRTNLHIL